jgi:hypothetical protein
MYARVLRLRRLRITGMTSFLLVECAIAVGILLALAELVSWWAVPLLPILVAAVVKVNDMVGPPRAAAPPSRSSVAELDDFGSGDRYEPQRTWSAGVDRPRQRRAEPDHSAAVGSVPVGAVPVGSMPVGSQLAGSGQTTPGLSRHRHPNTDLWDGPTVRTRHEESPLGGQVPGLPVAGAAPAGAAPTARDPEAPPLGAPGAQAPRRAQVIGAAVRRSMAQAQANSGSGSGGSVLSNSGTRGSSGRHSRGDETTARRSRFNERGFGRSA